jgi:putative ABC transport system permease protein
MLDKLHNGEADYSLVIPEQLLRQSRQTQHIFNIVMGCIAGISLLVGGIGIMNIMLANVLERTKEIGVHRERRRRQHDGKSHMTFLKFSRGAEEEADRLGAQYM